MSRRNAQYRGDPRERSIGRLLVTLIGLILVTAGFILTWLFLSDRDLLFSGTTQSSPDAPPTLARYRFDSGDLIAPTRLVTRVKQRTLGNVTNLDLLLPWAYNPGTVPLPPATADEFNDWIVLSFEKNNKDELTPVERYGEIYPVYFDGEPEKVSGNLLRYKFKENSPYSDLTLYVATVDGKHIVHRCDRKPSVLGPILCERTIALTNDMNVRFRFALEHLEQWAQIERNVSLALTNMFSSTQR